MFFVSVFLLILDTLREHHIKLRIGETSALAAIIVAQLAFIAELPLPRRVVHQRHQSNVRTSDQLAGFFNHTRCRNFTPQMQEMIGTQQIRIARSADRVCQNIRLAVHVLDALLAPDDARNRAPW